MGPVAHHCTPMTTRSLEPTVEPTVLLALMVGLLLVPVPGIGQQVPDTAFRPETGPPAHRPGTGPRVVLDEAHNNFHTVDGRYQTFAGVLRRDGFVVEGGTGSFTAASLADVDLLVIANALHDSDVEEWRLPNPSAFTQAEIQAVSGWVRNGGSLLLIADHMPFPGAAADLAASFGFELMNGFAGVDVARGSVPLIFRTSDGGLSDHPIVRGGGGPMRVDSVATFTGEAFRIPPGAVSLLTLPPGSVSLNPEVAWEFMETTDVEDVGGWSQGAVAEVGRGRVAVFGEAAMFSAQLAGPNAFPMGMNAPLAAQNPLLLVNLVRWLTRTPSNSGGAS